MTTVQQNSSGGGWFSKLVVVVLFILAIGLYLWVLRVERTATSSEPAPQASVRVVEHGVAEVPVAAGTAEPRDLPEDQMALIRRVFAPELSTD